MRKLNPVFSYLLIIAGAILLFQSAHIFFEARLGQREARRELAEKSSNSSRPTGKTSNQTRQVAKDGEAIAKLSIPRLNAVFYVVEGDDDQDLLLGPGHMPGTAMPGTEGNCVIAGHRDTHFRVLKQVKKGDEIILETGQGRFVYRVGATYVVRPTNRGLIQPTSDAELHLITCYPFHYIGAAPKRFVVEAELEGTAPGPAQETCRFSTASRRACAPPGCMRARCARHVALQSRSAQDARY